MADNADIAKKIARSTMPDMVENDIPPTPENYAVWYQYMAGNNQKLVDRINDIKKSGNGFGQAVMRKLYEEFLSDSFKKAEIQRQSYNAQSLVADIVGLMSSVDGETSSYNQHLDDYIDKLSGKYKGDETFQKMMKDLLQKTTAMRESSGDLQQKLVESRQEAEQLRSSIARITEEANRDALTGLYNRKVFDRSLKEMASIADDTNRTFSLLMLDIDHFKEFNDKHGHQVGDEVLKIVAHELMNSVKGSDVVTRYGGEEFAVLLPNTPLPGAMTVAENLRKSIASKELTRRDTQENFGVLTVSIGAAQYRAGKDKVPPFIKRADDALYRSKKGGRNRVTAESHITG